MEKKTAMQKAIEGYHDLGCTIEVILLNKRLPKTLRDQLAADSSNFYLGLKHLRGNEEREQLMRAYETKPWTLVEDKPGFYTSTDKDAEQWYNETYGTDEQ